MRDGDSRDLELILSAASKMTATEFIEVGKASEIPVGAVRSVLVGDRRIALYHTPSGFYASDNTCPHRGGPLAEGDLLGEEIVCPWHLWSFDVRSGMNPGNPESVVRTHEVRIDGDRILVRVPQATNSNGTETTQKA